MRAPSLLLFLVMLAPEAHGQRPICNALPCQSCAEQDFCVYAITNATCVNLFDINEISNNSFCHGTACEKVCPACPTWVFFLENVLAVTAVYTGATHLILLCKSWEDMLVPWSRQERLMLVIAWAANAALDILSAVALLASFLSLGSPSVLSGHNQLCQAQGAVLVFALDASAFWAVILIVTLSMVSHGHKKQLELGSGDGSAEYPIFRLFLIGMSVLAVVLATAAGLSASVNGQMSPNDTFWCWPKRFSNYEEWVYRFPQVFSYTIAFAVACLALWWMRVVAWRKLHLTVGLLAALYFTCALFLELSLTIDKTGSLHCGVLVAALMKAPIQLFVFIISGRERIFTLTSDPGKYSDEERPLILRLD